MQFEYDPDKSRGNSAKHGIDFLEAQMLWSDPCLVEIPSRPGIEPRFIAIAKIGGRHWSAICVRRGDATRLISVRRARKQEIDVYESG